MAVEGTDGLGPLRDRPILAAGNCGTALNSSVPSVAKKNEKTNLTEIKTKTKPKTKRVKLPTGGRFAPPSQVPPLLFSFSFSFYFL